jgi:hypothetical protein
MRPHLVIAAGHGDILLMSPLLMGEKGALITPSVTPFSKKESGGSDLDFLNF